MNNVVNPKPKTQNLYIVSQTNKFAQQFLPVSLAKPVLLGGGIAFLLISFFVFGVDEPDPAWGKRWMIKPLLITPIVGAVGGVFYFFMDQLSYRNGFNKTVAILLGLLGFVVALWLGIVLGLNGTMWN